MDDFVFDQDGVLDFVRWWGEMFDPDQFFLPRQYYIAIYEDEDCQPGALVHRECVVPSVVFVGTDCNGGFVIEFISALTGGFKVEGGKRYWLQISEDDDDSANPGAVEDFRWSGHRRIRGCDALQVDTDGNVVAPLIDPCDNEPVDLAFELRAI